jgi:hypothetical protein
LPQTDAEKAMMATINAMRKAGTIKYQKILDGEIKVKDKPKQLVKFRDNKVIDKMIEISRLEKDLQRQQDQDELLFTTTNTLTGLGHNERLHPLLKETLEQNNARELLKALHTDKNGRIAITDIGLREKILHHPSNVEVRTIGSNKVALVAKSSGHDNFRILGNYAPTSGELMTDHFKTLHGDKYTKKGELPMNPYVSKGYENEPIEFPETIEDDIEERKKLKKIKENYQSKLRMRKSRKQINNS